MSGLPSPPCPQQAPLPQRRGRAGGHLLGSLLPERRTQRQDPGRHRQRGLQENSGAPDEQPAVCHQRRPPGRGEHRDR